MTLFDNIFAGQNGIAKFLIDDFSGTDATIEYLSGGGYDPRDMTLSGEVQISQTLKVSPPSDYNTNEIDETTILKGDLKCLMSAVTSNIVPIVGASMVYKGVNLRIVNVQKIDSGDQTACYKLQLRRV